MRFLPNVRTLLVIAALWTPAARGAWAAQPVVPGTGEKALKVGDDFEDEKWNFIYNLPKSSKEQDEHLRLPWGRSQNGRWYEGNKRGCPDVVRRVATPEGGIPKSKGALLIKTRLSGIPGEISYKMEQDDLVVSVRERLGGFVPMSWSPSLVVRVYLPPFDQWENRSGIHFGFRGDCEAWVTEPGKGLFASEETHLKEYWPGIFVQFASKHDSGYQKDSANFLFRAGPQGWDFPGPEIKQAGWWTLGLSFTPNGEVHYYVSPGVDDLTEKDYVTSQFPYGYQCNRLNNFFFNVANNEDGRNSSTSIVIDDPSLYFLRDGQTVRTSKPKPSAATSQTTAPAKPTVKPNVNPQTANSHQPLAAPPLPDTKKSTAAKPQSNAAQGTATRTPAVNAPKTDSVKPKIATSTATDQPKASARKPEAKGTPKVMATKPPTTKVR